jgi:CHAT domain-containing protein
MRRVQSLLVAAAAAWLGLWMPRHSANADVVAESREFQQPTELAWFEARRSQLQADLEHARAADQAAKATMNQILLVPMLLNLDRTAEALETAREAEADAKQLENPSAKFLALAFLRRALLENDRFDEAAQLRDRTRAAAKQLHLAELKNVFPALAAEVVTDARIELNNGNVFVADFAITDGLAATEQAMSKGMVSDPAILGLLHRWAGVIEGSGGFGDSEGHLRKAVELLQGNGPVVARERISARSDLAEEIVRRCIAIFNEVRSGGVCPIAEADKLSQLALEEELRAFGPQHSLHTRVAASRSGVLLLQNKPRDALDAYRSAAFARTLLPLEAKFFQISFATLLRRYGDAKEKAEAITLLKDWLPRVGTISFNRVQILSDLAADYAEVGDWANSLEMLVTVRSILEQIPEALSYGGRGFQPAGQAQREVDPAPDLLREIFRNVAILGAFQWQRAPGEAASMAEASFHWAQRARMSEPAAAMARAAARAAARPELEPLRRRRDQLAISLRENRTRVGADRLLIYNELVKTSGELASQDSPSANFAVIDPPTIEQVQRSLRQGEALVQYLIRLADRGGIPSIAAWVITPSAFSLRVWQAPPDIARQIDKLRSVLEPPDPADLPPIPTDIANQLYTAVVAPIAGALEGVRQVFIIPDGALERLPFAVLLTPPSSRQEADQPAWLIRRFAITTLPFAWAVQAPQRASHSVAPEAFGGFGDPAYPPNGLAPLPDTASELKAVAESLGARPGAVHLGDAVTPAAVEAAPLSRYRTLEFATHALAPGELSSAEAALAMAPDRTAPDGLLPVSRIATLKLNADLVVLSGCSTAGPGHTGGETLSGLASAFLFAGSRAVLVSQWPTISDAASRLIVGMFNAVAHNPGLGRAASLRQSMLEMADNPPSPEYAHPRFWAPFVIVGAAGSSQP